MCMYSYYSGVLSNIAGKLLRVHTHIQREREREKGEGEDCLSPSLSLKRVRTRALGVREGRRGEEEEERIYPHSAIMLDYADDVCKEEEEGVSRRIFTATTQSIFLCTSHGKNCFCIQRDERESHIQFGWRPFCHHVRCLQKLADVVCTYYTHSGGGSEAEEEEKKARLCRAIAKMHSGVVAVAAASAVVVAAAAAYL